MKTNESRIVNLASSDSLSDDDEHDIAAEELLHARIQQLESSLRIAAKEIHDSGIRKREQQSRITSLEQQLADSETRVGLLESQLKAIVMQLNNSLHFAERLAGIRRIIEGIPNLILKEPLVLQDDSIESWLNKLPAGYRELALANYRAGSTTRKRADSVTSALWCAFIWQDTPEGYDFWLRVATRFGLADHSLPALPEIQQP